MAQRQARHNGRVGTTKSRKKRDMLQFTRKLEKDMKKFFLKDGNSARAAQLRNERLSLLSTEEANECLEWMQVTQDRPHGAVGGM